VITKHIPFNCDKTLTSGRISTFGRTLMLYVMLGVFSIHHSFGVT